MPEIPGDPTALLSEGLLEKWRSSSTRSVVFLHGFEGHPDSYDLAPLATALSSTVIHRVVGPVEAGAGFSWWTDETGHDTTPEAMDAALDALIAQLPDSTDPVVLVGFSQGAAVALGLALLRPSAVPPVAAVVAVAGFLAFPPDRITGRPPVLFVHPTDDAVVDVFLAQRAARVLTRHGIHSKLAEIAGDHSWSSDVIRPIAEFLCGN